MSLNVVFDRDTNVHISNKCLVNAKRSQYLFDIWITITVCYNCIALGSIPNSNGTECNKCASGYTTNGFGGEKCEGMLLFYWHIGIVSKILIIRINLQCW